jgi:hypothetical protein
MFLGAMQECLTELYGLDLVYDINDFLVTDRVLADSLGGGERPVDEKLLIADKGDEAHISLYLQRELVERLIENDPTTELNAGNLADFWTAFEGVSHFTYFVFKASADQSVTLLELELQAEVDKFVGTGLFLQRQGDAVPSGLHRWLFDVPRLDGELTAVEHERYERANHYAARYCRRIQGKLLGGAMGDAMRRELRHFYRLPRQEKIGLIDAPV